MQGALVPPFILQPLIENAIQHGTAARSAHGTIAVEAWRDNGRVHLVVRDNGPGLPSGWSLDRNQGIGIANTRERLRHLYGEQNQSLNISEEPAVACVSISACRSIPRQSLTAVDRIRTIIVDDEKPARTRLLALLEPRSDIEVVGVARDGREAVELVRTRKPDLLFLDIHMPKLDGFGVLREISPARLPLTIFVTAHDRYAVRAFEAHAVDYLLKPFSDERFETALEHARESLMHAAKTDWISRISNLLGEEAPVNQGAGPLERIVLRAGGRVTFVELKDLDWISAAGVYLHLHISGKTHLYRSSISAFLQRLDPHRFVRIHRSTVINTDRIRELRPRGHGDFTVVLHDGRELTLSRAYRSQLERWLRQSL